MGREVRSPFRYLPESPGYDCAPLQVFTLGKQVSLGMESITVLVLGSSITIPADRVPCPT